ncbi:hypothetical protein TNCV_2593781 [Trichonephila clavipes]|nr:hypothetical protein TNCV_2593781 [Trichonephila clavipes]
MDMDVLLFGYVGIDVQIGINRIIKRLLKFIRTWRNIDLSESRLKLLCSREQHEHAYLKRVCCLLWTKIPIPVYGCMSMQPEDLEQLSIVYCRGDPYVHFMYRECMLWSIFPVPVHGLLPLQPEDLEHLSIVYCKSNPYIRFLYR